MKNVLKKVITLIVSILLILSCVACSSSNSRYDRNVENGVHKAINGQYGDMTDDEKKAANDFFEWQKEQDY